MILSTIDRERFFSKVNRTDDCWLWIGAVQSKGYGSFSFRGRRVSAHRLSFEIHVSPVPSGMMVCHTCDVRNCVNPDHLFVGTASDNRADADRKGRSCVPSYSSVGENHHASKLTEFDVRSIRKFKDSGWSDARLANEFGIARGTVFDIVSRRTWKHIG